ncbi:MAG TPA: class I SAM-dependent methyltransferase, partial [Gemmataceae bacterium]|nr:class I SAM-dependent methyltransferase [Gemmataceae bacterium]
MRSTQCRVCRGRALQPFLDLGPTALANRFLRPEQAGEEPTFPLRLVLCRSCGLVQIDEEVAPETLFSDYIYVSGTSDLIFQHAAWLAEFFVRNYQLTAGDLVVEVASNDGTVLKALRPHGVRVVGVEPADNLARHARHAGLETVCAFFGEDTVKDLRERFGAARLVLARHVLAHVPDLHGFVRGLAAALAEDGVAAVEVPHLLLLREGLQYDTVYHEHLCYFSVRVLRNLFERCGLELIHVQDVAIHGGSILVTAQRQGGPRPVAASVAEQIAREETAGLHLPGPWLAFGRRVAYNRLALRAELDRLHSAGRTVAGYGAPAKGMTLLAYCDLGPERIAYLVDRSPHKQGLLTPGHHIPIYPPEKLLTEQPDVVLVLAWNFLT